ncbi:Cof-type HAD-IIB family hydrolase [Faecalibacter sp. LW9]|uniref:Cof-type HAD-IIB family hydrolase n=1 Tax=Faecalibacter sp. LW9 TaxID=3103144 RepID=UPI002AFE8283|nr:Cof-type HAD-IIB family hydrolase [Faecalibacter sp. LW9]
MPIESIFFDFDGTLQGFENHTISDSTKEALYILKQNHYKVFIATGRNRIDMPRDVLSFGFDGFINNNGAMCSDAELNSFYVEYIAERDIQAMIEYDSIQPIAFSLMTEKGFAINRINEYVEKAFEYFGMNVPELIDFETVTFNQVMQMNIFVNEEQEKLLMQEVFKNSESSRWMPYFADVNPKGINKMKGIQRMSQRYHLDLSKTMAFGDGGNDVPMLQGCTIGMAMGNAKDDVKEIADYVTTSADDDGIWKALKYYKLI